MTTVHRIEVPIPYAVRWVNCYYIHDSAPTLIDTGHNTDEDLAAIRLGVEKGGGNLTDIRRIIVTHGHTDHVGLAGRIADISGAEAFVHRWESTKLMDRPEDDMALREAAFRDFLLETGLPEDLAGAVLHSILRRWVKLVSPIAEEKALESGEIFPFDDFELQVIHTPGHSPGSICLYDKASGNLFTGDSLVQELISNPASERVHPDLANGYNGLTSHQTSLERLKDLPIRAVQPGHGHPFADLAKRVALVQDHHRRRRENLLQIMMNSAKSTQDVGMTGFTLVTELFRNFSEAAGFVNLSGVRAHLELLEHEGLVTHLKNGYKTIYYCAG